MQEKGPDIARGVPICDSLRIDGRVARIPMRVSAVTRFEATPFAGRRFRYEIGDAAAKTEVEIYARSIGEPESQRDWEQ